MSQTEKIYLLIVNDAPYGSKRSYNALSLVHQPAFDLP